MMLMIAALDGHFPLYLFVHFPPSPMACTVCSSQGGGEFEQCPSRLPCFLSRALKTVVRAAPSGRLVNGLILGEERELLHPPALPATSDICAPHRAAKSLLWDSRLT